MKNSTEQVKQSVFLDMVARLDAEQGTHWTDAIAKGSGPLSILAGCAKDQRKGVTDGK